jgi:hypothetical protein
VIGDQYGRICSAIEYTLEQLRKGPTDRQGHESDGDFEWRFTSWYDCKHRFVLYAIKCLKSMDKARADVYLDTLRQLGDEI